MNVRDLVEIETFSAVAKLVAGEEGLNNSIFHITVMEAPDFPSWVNGGEFVLSTFFSIKDDVEAQIGTIQQLAVKGVAALGIKIDRFIDTIHPTVIQAADQVKLPLFAITKESKFRDLIHTVSKELIYGQTSLEQEAAKFHDSINKLSFQRESPETLCREIEKRIGYTCAILTPRRELIAGYIHEDTDIDSVLDEMALNYKLLDDSSLEYRHGSYIIIGCYVKGELVSLIVFSGIKTWGPRESFLAKHAANAISLHFLEEHIQGKVEKRMVSSFFDEIVFKEVNQEVFAERADFFGWKIYDHFQAMVVHLVEGESLPPDAFHLLADRWGRQLKVIFPSVLTLAKKDEFIVLISIPDNSNFKDLSYHKRKMNDLLKGMFYRSSLEKRIRVGIGSLFDNPAMLQYSYRQAISLVEFSRQKEGILWYASDYMLHLFLLHSKDQIERKLIQDIAFAPVIAYDQKHGTELQKSLRALLKSDSLEEAADALFIHPNTLRNRLNKVTEITGVNPIKTQGRLMFLTAMVDDL